MGTSVDFDPPSLKQKYIELHRDGAKWIGKQRFGFHHFHASDLKVIESYRGS